MTPPEPIDPSGAAQPPPSSKPPRQRTAEEERDLADWEAIAASDDFRSLLARKTRFIWIGSVFFLIYYFSLPVLVGWFPELMEKRVGPINYAYLFALSQFVMAWVVAGIYVKVAGSWDRDAEKIIAKLED